jgi:Mu-like prophage I protein
MPWSKKNPPRPSKNWPSAAQSLCIRVANATLRSGGSDTDAIRACIGAVKKKYPKAIGSGKKSASDLTAGFYTVTEIELKEEDGRFTSRIPVVPAGKFKHPWYGDLDFSEPILRSAKRHFDAKLLGTDIMVDENHDRGQALGWFKSVTVGETEIDGQKHTGLHAVIDWTPKGRELLSSGVYKYFSAEFGSYTDQTGKKTSNVLFGGGLTNRPFFKQMPAIKFGEEGTAEDRFIIGVFADQSWEFDDTSDTEAEEETDRAFYTGYADPDEESDDEDEEEEDEETGDDEEDGNVKYADLIAKLNKDLGLKLSADNEEASTAAIERAFGGASTLDGIRKKFAEAGFKFDENADVAEVVLAGYNTLKTQNGENTEAIKAIRQELSDTKAATAVDKLVDTGKIAPAKREQYIKLFHTNNELFEEMTKDLEPVVQLGEIGGDGIPQPPGSGSMEKFLEPAKAVEEADRYMNLVPDLEDRLAARRK